MNCKYLVLSSGGLKCLAFLGHLKNINNDLSELKAISGCSAGSVIGFLLCMYTPDEIIELLHDPSNVIFRAEDLKISNLLNNYGLNNGDHILNFMQRMLHKYCSQINITFEDFALKTNIDLFICTTNINKKSCEIFSKYTHPKDNVITSIMMSICIPFYFKPIVHNDCYYIDGAFYNPVPFKIIQQIYEIPDDLKKSVHIYYIHEKSNNTNVNSLFDYIVLLGNFVRNSLVSDKGYDEYTCHEIDTYSIPFINHKYTTKDYLKIINDVKT